MRLQYNLICLKLSLLWKRKSILYNPIVSCLFVWGGVERMVERWWKGFVEMGWKKKRQKPSLDDTFWSVPQMCDTWAMILIFNYFLLTTDMICEPCFLWKSWCTMLSKELCAFSPSKNFTICKSNSHILALCTALIPGVLNQLLARSNYLLSCLKAAAENNRRHSLTCILLDTSRKGLNWITWFSHIFLYILFSCWTWAD